MEKTILHVLVGNRTGSALKVQKILTEMGCFIKTRLGIHDGSPDQCTNTGLIILELMGSDEQKHDLVSKLEKVPDVAVKLTELRL